MSDEIRRSLRDRYWLAEARRLALGLRAEARAAATGLIRKLSRTP